MVTESKLGMLSSVVLQILVAGSDGRNLRHGGRRRLAVVGLGFAFPGGVAAEGKEGEKEI
ncbi:hypothetical protein COLO4_05962 [Corchorus olitorius]|uniref:Uncharacterized protein n=1 Tax=Corchorus olitorius TaxID=93759 RepID=A0A1R3KPC9_9ROSI|nr:hypothetical protein COLO4_05962 [Corchorus olitorius]